MALFEKIRTIPARYAQYRKLQAELASLSDAELNDLGLSYAKVLEVSRQQAFAY